MYIIFTIAALVTSFFINIYTTFTFWECLSMSLFVFYMLYFLDNFGKRFVILEVIILMAIFICLVMPIMGYHYFNATNRLARTWTFHMRIPSNQFYSYMFPATIAMILGMKLPVFYRSKIFQNHEQYLINAKKYVSTMKYQGVILVMIGVFATVISKVVPSALATVTYLLRFTMFVGMFYCLYSNFAYKRLVLTLVFGLLAYQAVSAGMFGELVFMSLICLIQVMLGRKFSFSLKVSLAAVGLFLLIVLQAVKPAFRMQTWKGNNKESKVEVFADLFQQKLSNPSTLFSNEKALFAFYGRFNEGQIISRVMYNVPQRFPYANGETIFLSLVASVVPRILWPDKPEAGGAANFMRFVGIKLKGYSIGLSPFGEAYGNFGAVGGISFMFAFGLLFNFIFHWMLKTALKVPSLILWFPFVFFYAVQIESDVVTMINSLSKFALLAYLYYRFFPPIFKLKL